MSTIRRQSIISTGIIYLGFALGFLNTYLFTRQGGFTPSEYGLYGTFMGVANIINAFANFGMSAYIYKFYPFYQDNLKVKDNDMMGWAFVTSMMGFLLVLVAPLLIEKRRDRNDHDAGSLESTLAILRSLRRRRL